MNPKRRLIFAAVMLLIGIVNYRQLPDSGSVRAVAFLNIFAIGALSAIVIREIVGRINNK